MVTTLSPIASIITAHVWMCVLNTFMIVGTFHFPSRSGRKNHPMPTFHNRSFDHFDGMKRKSQIQPDNHYLWMSLAFTPNFNTSKTFWDKRMLHFCGDSFLFHKHKPGLWRHAWMTFELTNAIKQLWDELLVIFPSKPLYSFKPLWSVNRRHLSGLDMNYKSDHSLKKKKKSSA